MANDGILVDGTTHSQVRPVKNLRNASYYTLVGNDHMVFQNIVVRKVYTLHQKNLVTDFRQSLIARLLHHTKLPDYIIVANFQMRTLKSIVNLFCVSGRYANSGMRTNVIVVANNGITFNDGIRADGVVMAKYDIGTNELSPYTFPEGRVDAPQGVRESAVLYTDWAIWDFIQRAREMPWFDHTVFVIVADHQSRAAGKAELPISRYHIPCLIYSPGLIEPGQTDRLISQMDLAPTLLGMLGLSYEASFMGRDIFHSPESGDRAFISTYQSMGYVKGDKLIILKPGKHSETYEIEDFEQSRYRTLPRDEALEQEAITWYQGASDLFAGGKLKGGK